MQVSPNGLVPANREWCFGRWNSDSARHIWENRVTFQFYWVVGESLVYKSGIMIEHVAIQAGSSPQVSG